MKEQFLSVVDSLDKAAVLVTLGFECSGRHAVQDVDLGSVTERTGRAYIWEFAGVSAGGLRLADVCAEFALGMPAGRVLKPLGAVAAARLALHNFRVLRKGLKTGAPVWCDDLLTCCRLGNFRGLAESREVVRVGARVPGVFCRAEFAAVLAAVGYCAEEFCVCDGRMTVRMRARDGQADVFSRIALLRDEVWLHDVDNFEPLAVGLLAIRNRGLLLQEVSGETLRVHKNGLVGMVSKRADERVLGELCKRMNL